MKIGAVLSSTTIVWTKFVAKPLQSVNVYVLVIIKGFPLQPLPPLFVSETVTVTVPLQLSVTSVTKLISATGISDVHCKSKMSDGAIPVGGVVSSIVKVCTQFWALPSQSVKVYVYVAFPSQVVSV